MSLILMLIIILLAFLFINSFIKAIDSISNKITKDKK